MILTSLEGVHAVLVLARQHHHGPPEPAAAARHPAAHLAAHLRHAEQLRTIPNTSEAVQPLANTATAAGGGGAAAKLADPEELNPSRP